MARRPLWLLCLLLLLLARVPSVVEPTGNDQNIYMYVADRIRVGEVPYVNAWDQKPPAVFAVYAGLRAVWPYPSVVAIADLLAAGLTAWGLVLLGGRTTTAACGALAAATFLLFGHPSLTRLSGVYVRGQCEIFIAFASTAAILLAWRAGRSPGRLLCSGVCLGLAFWFKYNALAYVLPVAVAAMAGRGSSSTPKPGLWELGWIAAGFAAVGGVTLTYFAAQGALEALRLATLDYNLRYSGETYTSGLLGALAHILATPFSRARVDMLWFLGAVGAVLLTVLGFRRERPVVLLCVTWLLAVVVSIAVNGARDLPQYFVQAGPPLAFAWAAGTRLAWQIGPLWRLGIVLVVVGGLWRVGVETPVSTGLRLGGLPELTRNLTFDLQHMTGRIDRETYLTRFAGGQKYDAREIASLAEYVRTRTDPGDRIFVFGFAPGVYVDAQRRSASRFFWSRPIILEFAAERRGYGSAGLLEDLEAGAPAVVALQKQDWWPDVTNSADFFLAHPQLHAWLISNYTLDRETAMFSVWQRRP